MGLIVMVTAKIEEIDRLLGLEIGADDYICKPYIGLMDEMKTFIA